MDETSSSTGLLAKVIAVAVLLLGAWILIKAAVGIVSAVFWTVLVIGAILAVIWAVLTLRS